MARLCSDANVVNGDDNAGLRLGRRVDYSLLRGREGGGGGGPGWLGFGETATRESWAVGRAVDEVQDTLGIPVTGWLIKAMHVAEMLGVELVEGGVLAATTDSSPPSPSGFVPFSSG
ncbi:uncharacterized protein PGTG_05944 [Puccinia graminis f. sp. tritici CRL 75-36-700-3]|uniref:Uncharacterized protein n=1 Tax=Puccinia graminis f. sp. tritici (strain CRL 75-36-700-3 / race SCCL) TaxID=418459 RepID=E3K652_PUCGT|nr:uncharacterized protein PGTG_05944 [Puccinia graminis f. sp. tritici CRL 75-36-700-3]EFP79623.1 hypothetical protein PGTG_05944 [Puccinia graminis f. sp. tritici CRL 75-36-700-3]